MYTNEQLQQLRKAHPKAADLYDKLKKIRQTPSQFFDTSWEMEFISHEAIIEHTAQQNNELILKVQELEEINLENQLKTHNQLINKVNALERSLSHCAFVFEQKDLIIEANAARIKSLEEENEYLKGSTNSPLGSTHNVKTLLGQILHIGEFLKSETPEERIIRLWGDRLYNASQELIKAIDKPKQS